MCDQLTTNGLNEQIPMVQDQKNLQSWAALKMALDVDFGDFDVDKVALKWK